MRWFLAVLLVVAPLAGCLGDRTDDADTESASFELAWSEKALAFGPGHDHEDRDHHRGLSTPNFELVGYDPLVSAHYGTTAGAYFCGDVQPSADDGRRIAAVESRSEVGFALADVTDPAEPVWLGELVMPTTRVYDLTVLPGSEYVVLVTSDLRDEEVLSGADGVDGVDGLGADATPGASALSWRDACTGELRPVGSALDDEEDPVPRPMSVILIDITDPSTPTIVEHQPLFGNGHAAFSTEIDGRTWVVVTTTRFPRPGPVPSAVDAAQANQVTMYLFYELVDAPTGPHLELVSLFRPPPDVKEDPADQTLPPRGHDAWMAQHPVTGQTVAYLAGGDRFTILDMSDPSAPTELGRWSDTGPGRAGYQAHLHGAFPLPTTWDGRHYTLLGPEFAGHPVDHPSGIVWALDTTDPSDIFPVGGWTLPHDVEWEGTFQFSNHYFMAAGTTLFISMYHAGIWAVDLTPLGSGDFVQLPSIGVYLPDRDPPEPVAFPERWAPTVEEALVLDDGTILTFDGNSGLYTLRFDASNPAPPPAPWPVEPP